MSACGYEFVTFVEEFFYIYIYIIYSIYIERERSI